MQVKMNAQTVMLSVYLWLTPLAQVELFLAHITGNPGLWIMPRACKPSFRGIFGTNATQGPTKTSIWDEFVVVFHDCCLFNQICDCVKIIGNCK